LKRKDIINSLIEDKVILDSVLINEISECDRQTPNKRWTRLIISLRKNIKPPSTLPANYLQGEIKRNIKAITASTPNSQVV